MDRARLGIAACFLIILGMPMLIGRCTRRAETAIDSDAPAIIAAAVYAGHRYARELDAPIDPDEPLRHDRVDVGETPEGSYLMGRT